MYSPSAFSSPSPYRRSGTNPALLGSGGRTSAAALTRVEERMLRTDNRALSALNETHATRMQEMLLARTGLEAECALTVEMSKDSAVEKRALEQALRLAEQSLAGERCGSARPHLALRAPPRLCTAPSCTSRTSEQAEIAVFLRTLSPRLWLLLCAVDVATRASIFFLECSRGRRGYKELKGERRDCLWPRYRATVLPAVTSGLPRSFPSPPSQSTRGQVFAARATRNLGGPNS
jgi:hypothetical protein